MLNKIIIKPNTDEVPSGMVLVGSYQFQPGKLRILVSEDMFIETLESDKSAPAPLNITFSQRSPIYTITYDDSSNDDTDIKKKSVIEKFFGEHPLMTRNGKPTKYTKSGMYDMYSEVEKNDIHFDTWKEHLSVMNRLDSMSNNELCDVWYYYGVEPSGKKRGELIVKLGSVPGGMAIEDMDLNKKSRFLQMFSLETKSETDYIVNMRKCLLHGLIDDKVDGVRHNYYHGTTFVGTTFNDLIAYAKREDRIYQQHILPRLRELEENLGIGSANDASDDMFSDTKVAKKKKE
jgi:hypothetical protein